MDKEESVVILKCSVLRCGSIHGRQELVKASLIVQTASQSEGLTRPAAPGPRKLSCSITRQDITAAADSPV